MAKTKIILLVALYEMLRREDANYLQSIKNGLGQNIGELNYGRPAKWVEEYDE